MTPPRGACVWCSSDKFDKEHVIGKQITKCLDLPYPIVMHWDDWQGTPKQQLAIVLKRRVCKKCNGVWMRKLDDQFTELMCDSLRNNTPVTLNRRGQIIVATWAVKVALLLELYLHDRARTPPDQGDYFVLDARFRAVYSQGRPPVGTRVWLSAVGTELPPFFSGGGPIWGSRQRAGTQLVEGSTVGFHALFNLRSVLFRVIDGLTEDYEPQTGEPFSRLVQIWPRESADVEWTPEPHLTPTELATLATTPLVKSPPAEP